MTFTVKGFEKGFNPTLFDCMDTSLVSVLGKESVQTLYFIIQEKYAIPENEFPEKPVEMLHHMRDLLGEGGFRVIERSIVAQIRATFEINVLGLDINQVIELAKQSYLVRLL